MHIFFSGIGGAGIGPLALVAKQAGYLVSGSDKQNSNYITYLSGQGVDRVTIGQSYEDIERVHQETPIDWFVYTSALPMENPDAPELQFCRDNNVKHSKRDEFLNKLLQEKDQQLVAIAGTHGKTTTTAMTVWALQELNIPVSYILPAKTGFAQMGKFDPESTIFVYEADEFDRNFLSYSPKLSMITGIDWDHPDIYPTQDSYDQAFRDFLDQSDASILWESDVARLKLTEDPTYHVIDEEDPAVSDIALAGLVNRQNAWQVANALHLLTGTELDVLKSILDRFPGLSRRFEQIKPGLYSDYAHTPPKIRGALQLGHETAGDNLVIVYEGLHNTRQHFIKEELKTLFDTVKQLYVVPSYLAREDTNLELWSPADIVNLLSPEAREHAQPAQLNEDLQNIVKEHLTLGDTVVCLTAGGGGSLDEWLRQTFAS